MISLLTEHNGLTQPIQSFSLCKDLDIVAASYKDKMLRLLDPRTSKIISECQSHANIRDSKVIWLKDSNYLLTSGKQKR